MQTLRQVWVQNYYAPDAATGALRLRTAQDRPPGVQVVQSPYEGDARFSTKRETSWIGYRRHLTETCEADLPRLITQVATVPATPNEVEMTAVIQADRAARDLLPGEQLLAAGYGSAQHLVASAATDGIDLVGPALLDPRGQAAAKAGFALTHFTIDWEQRSVTCPQGKTSHSWHEVTRGE